jgi:hypothetical protein
MKRFFVVLFLFLHSGVLLFSLDLELNHWYDFQGKLGDKNIQLSFFTLPSGKLVGSYCSFSNESKIVLKGKVIGNDIFLTASINGEISSELKGKVFTDDQDRLELTWKNLLKNEEFMFKSVLMAVTAGTFKKRYTHIAGTDAALEAFVIALKGAVAKNDKSWMGDRIFYPLQVRVSDKSTLVIKNKSQWLSLYPKIFTPSFKERISLTFSHNLFNNYQGVMVGDGQLWINNAKDGTEERPNFQIISINP